MNDPLPLSRREALRRILAATALAGTIGSLRGFAAPPATGIGFDPNLLKKEIPWPRLLTDAEKRTATAFADILLPADQYGPAASALGIPDFIDEWVSAPYDQQVKERGTIREGLAWLDTESKGRCGKAFDAAPAEVQMAIVKEMAEDGSAAKKKAHSFFTLFRDRAAGGYFTTPEGWKAIGYTGNLPMAEFPGPTPEALAHVGLGAEH